MIATVSIYHNIYLTEEEQQKLLKRKKIKTIGVFIPTIHNNGYSNERAEEYFCEYTITNVKKDYPVLRTEEGWVFNIPQKKEITVVREKSYEIELKDFVEKKFPCQYIFPFKFIMKIKDKDVRVNQIHYIEIKSKEYLLNGIEKSRPKNKII